MMRTPPKNLDNSKNVTNDRRVPEIAENSKDAEKNVLAVRQVSRKVLRSPTMKAVGTPRTVGSVEKCNERVQVPADPPEKFVSSVDLADSSTPVNVNTRNIQLNKECSTTRSPRLEQITRMRGIEEEGLTKCVAILHRIKQAMERQKNISKDVKDGVSELCEQIDVIGSCRRIWKELEIIRNLEAEDAARNIPPNRVENLPQIADRDTPLTARSKRAASSPAAPVTHKKVKENGQDEWQTVTNRKTKRKFEKLAQTPAPQHKKESGKEKPKKRTRNKNRKIPEAVLIKPSEGKSYSEVLRDLKNMVKPEDAEVAIRSVRKTMNGAILLELAEGGRKEKFCEAIRISLKDSVNVSTLTPRTTIELRDLDALSEADEVSKAVRNLINKPDEEVVVRLTEPNTREQRRAFVTLNTEAAKLILKNNRVKIGWIYSRVKPVSNVQRCYRCFGTGHTQRSCQGPDRKREGLCIRCGKAGHKMKECANAPECCICMAAKAKGPVDHIPGSTKCPAYTRASRS